MIFSWEKGCYSQELQNSSLLPCTEWRWLLLLGFPKGNRIWVWKGHETGSSSLRFSSSFAFAQIRSVRWVCFIFHKIRSWTSYRFYQLPFSQQMLLCTSGSQFPPRQWGQIENKTYLKACPHGTHIPRQDYVSPERSQQYSAPRFSQNLVSLSIQGGA